jgi:type I restriction enzyme R subunit
MTPEEEARQEIDMKLAAAGWVVQDRSALNLSAARGVAVREVTLNPGYGEADYILFVDGKAAGVVEAKKAGYTLTGVEIQSDRYSKGFPDQYPTYARPLPFLYQSTGVETRFTNLLDPRPRSRNVFHFHKPDTLATWLAADPLPDHTSPSTLRSRLLIFPTLHTTGLWPAQIRAVQNLEVSLADDRPRSLIQMATGSGKTFTAISAIYRLIKHGDATRVLFLVDRGNLGRQTMKEFQAYTTPDDGRKFTELYNVQLLTSNKIDPVARVVITTIQRLYSMLRGDADLDPTLEEASLFEASASFAREPVPVEYNPALPPELFDVLFVDECHRSIYSLWRQVLEYFDAHIIGLTATPAQQTFAFFNRNLVMEYNHAQAVADGVNVDFEVYKIMTRMTRHGATIEAGPFEVVGRRDRATRAVRWERIEEDITYGANELDRKIVAEDQIRTIIRTFKDKLFTEIFPRRSVVPKTLIFAKDDSHADDIVRIVREEFGQGNDFCQKITYRTTGAKPEDLLASFRNSYNPRIVVTVDMIATGTDVKPLEIVMFMRAVKSRNFFEQMKGRGVRVIPATDFKAVTDDPVHPAKTHFVLIDCVGITEEGHEFVDTQPLDRQKSAGLDKLLTAVSFGTNDPDVYSTIASRFTRLAKRLPKSDLATLTTLAGGKSLPQIAADIVQALDADTQVAHARQTANLPSDAVPTEAQIDAAAAALLKQAAAPIATRPDFRNKVVEIQKTLEQTLDVVNVDEVLTAGYSDDARQRAQTLISTFAQYIEDNKDKITALQILYARPYAQRLRYEDIKALADQIQSPPRSWTPDRLWHAYEALERSKVVSDTGSRPGKRLLTDLVSLIRFTLHQSDKLIPFPAIVRERFNAWLAGQQTAGRAFTPDQRQWLDLMRDQIANSLHIEPADFDYVPFAERGGLGKAHELFGDELPKLLSELNEALAA